MCGERGGAAGEERGERERRVDFVTMFVCGVHGPPSLWLKCCVVVGWCT